MSDTRQPPNGLLLDFIKWQLDRDPEYAARLAEHVRCVECGQGRVAPCPRYHSGLHRWDDREQRFPGDLIEAS